MNNHTVPVSSPASLPSVGRREPERSEGDRSATDGKAGAAPDSHPDPEVVAQAKRGGEEGIARLAEELVSSVRVAGGQGQPKQQIVQQFALLRAERCQQVVLRSPGELAAAGQRGLATGGHVQRMRTPVGGMSPALDQTLGLELIER